MAGLLVVAEVESIGPVELYMHTYALWLDGACQDHEGALGQLALHGLQGRVGSVLQLCYVPFSYVLLLNLASCSGS